MSPEQANGDTTDHRTDLFSLGSVLYFMATGRPPFRAERAMGVLHRICHDTHRPAWQVNGDIPDELSDIIGRLLEKKTSRRFSHAVDVRESLARLLARTQQYGSQRRSRVARFFRRRPLLTGVAMVCLVSAIVAALMFVPSAIEWNSSLSDPHEFRSTLPENNVAPDSENALTRQQETIAAESAAYSAASLEISERLEQLETTSDATRFEQPAGDGFWQYAESFDARLRQLERDTFRDSPTSSTKEE